MSPIAAVIADTHIPRRASALPEGLVAYLGRADLILHAGDLVDSTLLDDLAVYTPTRAVRGNLDAPNVDLPEAIVFEFGGVRVAMIHDSGPKKGRWSRMRRRFPEARIVVFGHSHIPPAARRIGGSNRNTRSRCYEWRRAKSRPKYWPCDLRGRFANRPNYEPPPTLSGGRSPYRRCGPSAGSARVSPRACVGSTCHALSPWRKGDSRS